MPSFQVFMSGDLEFIENRILSFLETNRQLDRKSFKYTCTKLQEIGGMRPSYFKEQHGANINLEIDLDLFSNSNQLYEEVGELIRKLLNEGNSDFIFCHEDGDTYFYRISEKILAVKHIHESNDAFDFKAILKGQNFEFGKGLD